MSRQLLANWAFVLCLCPYPPVKPSINPLEPAFKMLVSCSRDHDKALSTVHAFDPSSTHPNLFLKISFDNPPPKPPYPRMLCIASSGWNRRSKCRLLCLIFMMAVSVHWSAYPSILIEGRLHYAELFTLVHFKFFDTSIQCSSLFYQAMAAKMLYFTTRQLCPFISKWLYSVQM